MYNVHTINLKRYEKMREIAVHFRGSQRRVRAATPCASGGHVGDNENGAVH
jgi:hypothetical protein